EPSPACADRARNLSRPRCLETAPERRGSLEDTSRRRDGDSSPRSGNGAAGRRGRDPPRRQSPCPPARTGRRPGRRVITIGLTGGIGSGKTAAAAILGELGATLIDADKVGHEE